MWSLVLVTTSRKSQKFAASGYILVGKSRSLSTLAGCRCPCIICQQPQSKIGDRRWSSSSSRNSRSNKRFQLDALPFSISPEEALYSFRLWAEKEQGLRYLLSYNSIRIGAAFVPVWSFDLNICFLQSNAHLNWKPPLFSVFGPQAVVHLPGISAYSGYSYRRSLVGPVHSTALVFMGDQTQPFGGWMLRDMKLQSSGVPIQVVPDAWNATQGRAFAIVKEELQQLTNQAWADFDGALDSNPPRVQTQVLNSRRVYMPTYVIEYKILGLEYTAFVSGCDQGAPVSGVSHKILGDTTFFGPKEIPVESFDFVARLALRMPSMLRPILAIIGVFLKRIWAKVPILGVAGGVVAGYRKIYQPWIDNQSASAEWERQREHEALMEEEDFLRKDDFVDSSGAARLYFFRNRDIILDALGGDSNHEEGDWYKDWEEWARQQWQQQQQRGQQQSAYQEQRQQQTYQRSKQKKTEYQWDFDPNDPYSVLGIQRGATKQEVSQAFRKEMLKHHPDTQPNASEAQKRRAVERSKYITEAYRKIKAQQKR